MMQQLMEMKPSGRVIHADGPDGSGYTLCGFAYEGEAASFDWSSEELRQVERGKVDCERCLAIIAYCKKIPARFCASINPTR